MSGAATRYTGPSRCPKASLPWRLSALLRRLAYFSTASVKVSGSNSQPPPGRIEYQCFYHLFISWFTILSRPARHIRLAFLLKFGVGGEGVGYLALNHGDVAVAQAIVASINNGIGTNGCGSVKLFALTLATLPTVVAH